MEKAQRRHKLFILSAVAAILLFAVMAALTLPATDDYQYRLFMRYGFDEFITRNKEHYETYNGRVFVHVCAQAVLAIGMWFFVPVCLSSLIAIPVFSALSNGRREDILPALGVFLPGLLLAPYGILNQGVLWVSSFFNYVFPTVLACLLLFLLRDAECREHPGALRFLACAACGFACGATTEQSGLVTLALAGFFLIRALVRKKGRLAAAIPFVAALEGISTIFLSPATTERVVTETENALATMAGNVLTNISSVSRRLADSTLNGLLLASLFLLTVSALTRPGPLALSKRSSAILGAVLTVLALASQFFTGTALTAVTVVLMVLAGLAAAALLCRGEDTPGLLTLMALFSQAVILFTESDGDRTSTPYFLYLLAAVSILSASRLQEGRALWRNIYLGALLCAALLCAVPFIGGMIGNYRVDLENRQNIREARETGVLNYRLDYDYTYTHQKVSITVWHDIFLEGEGLPEDTEMRFYSLERPNVYVDGELFYPVIRGDDGTDYICADIVSPLGGSTFDAVEMLDAMVIYTPWTRCLVKLEGSTAKLTWTDADGVERACESACKSADWLRFFPREIYETIFGLNIKYSEEDGAYYVTAPEMKENNDIN